MTTPTANPIPSTSPQDLLFNAEKLDEMVNSGAATYKDRFGRDRLTLAGVAAGGGGLGIEDLGDRISQQEAHARPFWAAVEANQRDVLIKVLGDSTGNEPTEWVYKMAQEIAEQCPTHTVKYRLFSNGAMAGSGGTDTWGSYVTLQIGTGAMLPDTSANTIYIDNASISGSNTFYFMGAREPIVWEESDPDLVISNFGHNLGTGTTEQQALPEWIIYLSLLRLHAPRAGIFVLLQNPRMDNASSSNFDLNGPGFSARMIATWSVAAAMVDAAVIDGYTPYREVPDQSIYMADTTHPNEAGMDQLTLPAVLSAIAKPAKLVGPAPSCFSPLTECRPNLAGNGRFSIWNGSAPDDFSFVNCTPAKDLSKVRGGLYSCKITIGAGTDPYVTQDLTRHLQEARGRTIALTVCLHRPSGFNSLAGRVALESGDVVSSTYLTSFPRGTSAVDGPEYAFAILTVPRSATDLKLRIYAGAADGSDSGKSFNVFSIGTCFGALPMAVSLEDTRSQFVTDYYADANAGTFIGNTGSLTVTGGAMTLVGAPSGLSDTYINLPGLVAGKTYRVKFRPVSATGGSTAGGCYMRNGSNGGSTNLSMASGTGDWTAGGSSVTFTFVAPATPVSIRPYAFTGTTGYVLDQWSIAPVESGIARAINLPISSARNADGTALAAAASAGKFGLDTGIAGAVTRLSSEAATASTKTSTATWEIALPNDYVAGRDLTVTVNANFGGTGAALTKSLTLSASSIADSAGTQTALTVSAAATLTNTAADYAFTLTGTSLSPGQRVLLQAVIVLQENGGVNPLTARLNSVRLS